MTGIPVLSDSLKGGNKLENMAASKGKETSDGYENVAAVFAAMLNGRMNLYSNSKGQSSSLADLDSEKKQGNVNSMQSDLSPYGLGSILGYGNLVLPFLREMKLQSDLPAGKEANSGECMSQGIDNPSLVNTFTNAPVEAGKNFEMAALNLVSLASNEGLASTGMTTLNPQSNNLGITELDKYRREITNLLVALSGVITDSTPEGNLLGVDSMGTKDLGQELAKIIQSWMTVSDDAGEETSVLANSSVAGNAGTKNPQQELPKIVQSWMTMTDDAGEETSVLANSSVAGNPGTKNPQQELPKIVQSWMTMTDDAGEETSVLANSSVAGNAGTKNPQQELPKIVQSWMTMTDDVINSYLSTSGLNGLSQLIKGLAVGSGGTPELNSKAANLLAALYSMLNEGAGGARIPQGGNEALINQLKGIGIGLESTAIPPKDTVFLANVQQKSEGTSLQESKFLKNFQGAFQSTFNEEVNKANLIRSVELFGTKDVQTQPSDTGVGVVANVAPLTLADGKIVAIPVWEQISTVVREQVMNKQQALNELDIQLHPADLGKIRIFLRLENGQVHLQMQASEAATGQLLQNQLSELRQNLMSQGVNCGSMQMGQGGERQQQSQGDEAQRTFHQSNILTNEDEDLISNINPLFFGQDGIRINVTA